MTIGIAVVMTQPLSLPFTEEGNAYLCSCYSCSQDLHAHDSLALWSN